MQQTRKTSFLKTLFAARRQAAPASRPQTLDLAVLRRVAGGTNPSDSPKGTW